MPFDISVKHKTSVLPTTVMNLTAIGILLLGVIIVLVFGTSNSGRATIFEWMLAFLLGGTFIGFLFGIPKILQGPQTQQPSTSNINNQSTNPQLQTNGAANNRSSSAYSYQQQVNTNLTEISDWLTKIIVGLGLVNLTKIPPRLAVLAKILAEALDAGKSGSNPFAYAFAYATIISYSILGFLIGYLATRLYLAGLFVKADLESLNLEALNKKVDQAAAAANSADQKAQFSLSQSPIIHQQSFAERDNVAANQALEDLIKEYNDTRATMSQGSLRTSKMVDIFSRMTSLAANLVDFDVDGALESGDDGKRLSGYAYCYKNPSYDQLENLINALVNDNKAFNQYWAIQALGKIVAQSAVQNLNNDLFKKLKEYYDNLKDGYDRKLELGKVFPQLKTAN